MELTLEILETLKDSGKNICFYSDEIIDLLRDFSSKDFNKYSRTSYYFWLNKKRPIPLDSLIFMMHKEKLTKIK